MTTPPTSLNASPRLMPASPGSLRGANASFSRHISHTQNRYPKALGQQAQRPAVVSFSGSTGADTPQATPPVSESTTAAAATNVVRASDTPKERFGFARTISSLFHYTRHANNRQMAKGLIYKWIIPTGLLAASILSGPIAIGVGLVAWPLGIWSRRHGQKMIDKLDPNQLTGHHQHIGKLIKLWDESVPNGQHNLASDHQALAKLKETFKEIVDTYNKLVETTFSDKEARADKLIARLQLKEGGWFYRKLEVLFHVNCVYRNQWQGKVIAWLRRTGRKLPPAFRAPVMGTSLVFQALLTAFTHKRVRQMLVK